MIDRLRFREHRTVRQIAAVIGRIVHRQPRVEAQPVEPVQRERVVPPVPSRALEDRSVDRRAVLLRAGRATPGRQAARTVRTPAAHVMRPAGRVGHGRAAARLVARHDGRQVAPGVPRRPVDAGRP